ncbi:zinc finger protein ZFAT-like [Watersipora subatra]|uniref:zinc finger protein ZFAT-like n=1 Tax=Watersipora subatra TaxID=2589382 RepID=UPI00355C6A21
MADDRDQLSLSEMRMLTSSVVHMDVKQIALCVITIPKLKLAIEELMRTSFVSNHLDVDKSQVALSGNLNPVYTSITDTVQQQTKPPPLHQKPASYCNSGSVPPNHPQEATAPDDSPLVTIPLDAVLAESARGSTEFSMIGDRIAVGKPVGSKAKPGGRAKHITCRVCQLFFYRRDQYQAHMRLHINDPNISIYSCEHCSFVTKRRGVFNTHVLRHTGDLPFKCQLCDYAGRQASLLRLHMQNKHPQAALDRSSDTVSTSAQVKAENS